MSQLRAQILASRPPADKFETVSVPEWGCDVTVRPMTGASRDRFEQAALKDPGNNIRARLVAYSACDPDGNFLFDANDVVELGNQPASALDRVFAVAMRINGIGTADIDALEKN